MFPCQDPPIFLMRVTCVALTPLTCKTFTTRGSASSDFSNNRPMAISCYLERIEGEAAPQPLYIVNPSNAPDCILCEQPVGAKNGTWGSVKALYR